VLFRLAQCEPKTRYKTKKNRPRAVFLLLTFRALLKTSGSALMPATTCARRELEAKPSGHSESCGATPGVFPAKASPTKRIASESKL
jgi:hypothetical protein